MINENSSQVLSNIQKSNFTNIHFLDNILTALKNIKKDKKFKIQDRTEFTNELGFLLNFIVKEKEKNENLENYNEKEIDCTKYSFFVKIFEQYIKVS